jgi:hypothetical protein
LVPCLRLAMLPFGLSHAEERSYFSGHVGKAVPSDKTVQPIICPEGQ